jgi:UDP-GlcNAc:undecaprenyl-phosphate GlcNAc-1-phosphate transferase
MPFLVALGLGLVLTPLLALLGRRVGLVDRPSREDGLKIHAEARPLTGGIGVVAATLAAVAVAGDGPQPLVTGAIVLLLAVGVLDDLVGLAPSVRLAAELAAGGLLAAGDVTLAPFGDLGPIVLVLAVPVVANAVNMMDGQDGLAGGLAAVAALGLSVVATADGAMGSLGPACAAALIAFLVWNRPPASVFLGDGGAYGVGGLLVVLLAGGATTWAGVAGGVACLGIFLLELVSTILRRTVTRSSLTSGDRAHVYDQLAERLRSRGASTAVLVVAGAVAAGVGGLAADLSPPVSLAAVLLLTAAGALMIRALWRTQRV